MQENQSLFSLSIDPVTKAHLNDAAKWARFLAIAGMVLLVIAFVFSFLMATVLSGGNAMNFTINGTESQEMSNSMRVGYLVGTVLVLAVAFFPLLFLLQFANRMKTALAANDQESLNVSVQSLKKYFRYVGIVLIIALALYALMFIMIILSLG
jgi:hypothetical protein